MKKSPSILSAAGLLAALAIVATLAGPAAASELFAPQESALETTGAGPAVVAGLMPGDALAARTIEVGAAGCLRYQLRAEATGTPALAQAIQVRITLQASGELLYAGPLAAARFGDLGSNPDAGRPLCDGKEILQIDGELPLWAGNEVQGASLSVAWIIEAVQETTEAAPTAG